MSGMVAHWQAGNCNYASPDLMGLENLAQMKTIMFPFTQPVRSSKEITSFLGFDDSALKISFMSAWSKETPRAYGVIFLNSSWVMPFVGFIFACMSYICFKDIGSLRSSRRTKFRFRLFKTALASEKQPVKTTKTPISTAKK